jgi:hypothetical protein
MALRGSDGLKKRSSQKRFNPLQRGNGVASFIFGVGVGLLVKVSIPFSGEMALRDSGEAGTYTFQIRVSIPFSGEMALRAANYHGQPVK